MSAKRLVITGRVQGVGFRHWMTTRAERMGVSGWVRNSADGSVEALLDGPADAVEELLRACRRGPAGAEVRTIEESIGEPVEAPGFTMRPTA